MEPVSKQATYKDYFKLCVVCELYVFVGPRDAQNCFPLRLCPNEDGFCLWWPRNFAGMEKFFAAVVLCGDTGLGVLCPFE